MGLDKDWGLILCSLDLLPVLREEQQEVGPAADATYTTATGSPKTDTTKLST